MTDWYGWQGRILRVDLSSGKITKEPLSEGLVRNFIGGRGVNSKILFDETGPDTNPLGPENRLIIGTGPITGTNVLGTGRFTITAKSPLTGILGDSSGGGHFGAEVKFAGYDHIIIQGKAKKPVYLLIYDDEVTIKDAGRLWGKTTWETSRLIREEMGDRDIKTMSIGPAGENLVKFACPITDEEAAPAETGMGAVMGSKKLKAVAVRGSKSVKVADPSRYEEIIRTWYENIAKNPRTALQRNIGTTFMLKTFNEMYGLTVKNAQELHRSEEEISQFYGENFVPKYLTRHFACFACPLPCQKQVLIHDGPYAGEKGRRPEFGPLMSMCSHLGVFDFPFGLKVMNMTNQLGIDAQELGPTLAMVFECYQRGILTRRDTDGLKLEWGNQQSVLKLVQKVAYREGFGDVVAEGCRGAAVKIGKGAEKYAYHIKGKSHPDAVRASIPWVLGFAMATRGWDHLRALGISQVPKYFDYSPIQAEAVRTAEHLCTVADSAEICKFTSRYGNGLAGLAEVLSALTGVDFSEEKLHQACDSVYNIERAYLAKNGIRRKDDIAPRHFYEMPIQEGPHKGRTVDKEKFEELKDAWYELRGSDKKTGAPTRKTLEGLGLKYVADELEEIGVYKE